MSNGVELATAWVRIVPTMDGIQGAISQQMGGAGAIAQAEGTKAAGVFTAGFGAKIGGVALALGAAFATRAVVDWAKDSIDALKNWETINAQTEAVIASTGGAAGVTADHIHNLATSLEGLTATQAEGIQEGANLLLTFKNIQNGVGEGNQIFDMATASLVDMARAMGTDPQNAAIQLGKALNDPIQGLASLSRVGIQFTDQQKDQIKSLVESGQTMEAQKIILGELQSQFGGSGAAYADTFAGKMYLLNDAVGDLGESIFSALMPVLANLTEVGTQAFAWLAENQGVMIAIAAIIGVLLVAAFIAWTASIWASTVALLANPVTWIILAIIALIAAVVLLVMNWDAVVAWVSDVWAGFIGWITDVTENLAKWWTDLWAGFGAWVQSVWDGFIGWIRDLFIGYVSWLMATGRGISDWWNGLWSGVFNWGKSVWDGYVNWVLSVFRGFLGFMSDIGRGLTSWWNGLWSGLGDFVGSAFRNVANFVVGGLNTVIDLVNGAIAGINNLGALASSVTNGAISWNVGTLPKIPMLAKGGIVMPKAGGVLSLLAERGRPEVVLPLDRLRDFVPALAGMNLAPFTYVAAPNQSLDSERDLWTALERRAALGWGQGGTSSDD